MGEATNETGRGVNAMSNESEAVLMRPGHFARAAVVISHISPHPHSHPSARKYTFLSISHL